MKTNKRFLIFILLTMLACGMFFVWKEKTEKETAKGTFQPFSLVTEITELPEDGSQVILFSERYGQMLQFKDGTAVTEETMRADGYVLSSEEVTSFTVTKETDGSYRFCTENGCLAAGEENILTLDHSQEADRWYLTESPYGYFIENAGNLSGCLMLDPDTMEFRLDSRSTTDNYRFRLCAPVSESVEKKILENSRMEERRPADGYVLQVFETTDIHGWIADAENAEYRLAFIADKINDARRESGEENVILLDTGDIFQANTLSNLVHGQCLTAAFEQMRYDAVSVGNHEFDWGVEEVIDPDATLSDYDVYGYRGDSSIPVIAGNILQNGKDAVFTGDHVILNRKAYNQAGRSMDVKIGVLGYAGDYGSGIAAAMFRDRGFSIDPDISKIEQKAVNLKEKEGCDAVILLSHWDALMTVHMLSADSAVDLVLGGHSHFHETGHAGNQIPYLEAGCYADAYGKAELVFAEDGTIYVPEPEIFRLTDRDALQDTKANEGTELDPDILDLSRKAIAYTEERLGDVLGYITEDLTQDPIRNQPYSSAMGNFLTGLLVQSGKTDISLINEHGIRSSFYIDKVRQRKDVTAADLMAAIPFTNIMYIYEVTGEELKELMEFVMDPDIAQKYLFSGLICHAHGRKVTSLEKDGIVLYENGSWIDHSDTKIYRVSINEYCANLRNTPFETWEKEGKLIEALEYEQDVVIRTFEEQAAGGLYETDMEPHLILE